MNIIYTCPECGHDLLHIVLTCLPPIDKYECVKCGWVHEEQDEIVRIPFIETVPAVSSNMLSNQACLTCMSNPANGGDGICHCTLGAHTMC